MFELTAELRPVDHFGVAVIGGYGSISFDDGLGGQYRFKVSEVGGQLGWYPLEAFDSLEVGAEVLYAKVSNDNANVQVSASADGLAMGPFVGYKLITSGGFTFVAQGGAEFVTARAHATDASSSASDGGKSTIFLLNLNIGWSF